MILLQESVKRGVVMESDDFGREGAGEEGVPVVVDLGGEGRVRCDLSVEGWGVGHCFQNYYWLGVKPCKIFLGR